MPEGFDRSRHAAPETRTNASEGLGLFTLPNVITFGRLCAVPAAVWLIVQHRLDLAFLVFVGAGVSDAVDGWLARVLHARSQLGAILDPIADKALLVSVYVTLAAIGVLPDWLAILVVFRDLVIVGGVILLFVMGQPPVIKPLLISKLNTVAQILFACVVLGSLGFDIDAGSVTLGLMIVVACTTLLSVAAYVAEWIRHMNSAAAGP